MENKKGLNLFFALIAFTIGLTLMKHIDFKHLTLKDPILDTLYIIVFVISIYMMVKKSSIQPKE